MMNLKELRNKVERAKGKQEQIIASTERLQDAIKQNKKKLQNHEKAREIIKKVATETQNQLSYNISDITSMALEAVFDDPYKLAVEFVDRRNRTECDILFEKHGEKIHPFSSGGGAIDVAAFALRVACWSMKLPRNRPVLILDEPFKHLKGEEANIRVLEMVREISQKMGLQIIMVSDERISRSATMENTDRLFEITMRKGKSIVTREK